MARSFYQPKPENTVEDYKRNNTYYHPASDIYYTMVERDGHYFQRQYQIDSDGRQTNISEHRIDYVLGSGNHVRAYLHRTRDNTLMLLPLAWYAENGGHWGMNPGYDRPDHQGVRRTVTYDCMFCHNGYPVIPAANNAPRSAPIYSELPEGIDCQRCHGDGEKHATLARGGHARAEEIRNSIVNPSRLSPERQLEVCMECHLETTSAPLPSSIVRYERGPFSYKPGEPLANFMVHFDQTARQDRFEITGSVYRLRQSKCFQKSAGALRCTTCHNPHEQVSRNYDTICRQCHKTGEHMATNNCVGCHMPKRRTDDVVHAVMTDHYIQRQKPAGDLLAERREIEPATYRGEVIPYYPASSADELYLAIAQVSQGANLTGGIARLQTAINKYKPANAEYYLQLADALCNAGRYAEALPVYEDALRREPESAAALDALAKCLSALRQFPRAEALLRKTPRTDLRLVQLGIVELQQGKASEAISAFEGAIELDPDMVEAYNSAGAIWLEAGESAKAEKALREAIRVQPNYAQAHNNLGNLLSEAGRFEEARSHFEAALKYQENYTGAHYNYALALSRVHRYDDAQTQIEAILRIDPRSAEAHEFLANLLRGKGEVQQAIEHYREAIRIAPEFSQANLDLGATLANSTDPSAALPYLRKAAQSSDAATRAEAQKLIDKLAKAP